MLAAMRPELKSCRWSVQRRHRSPIRYVPPPRQAANPALGSPRRAPISSAGSLRRPTSQFVCRLSTGGWERGQTERPLPQIRTNRESTPFRACFKTHGGVYDASRWLRSAYGVYGPTAWLQQEELLCREGGVIFSPSAQMPPPASVSSAGLPGAHKRVASTPSGSRLTERHGLSS
jgi:hypothetical protein